MTHYRDPLAALVNQIATKRAALEGRSGLLPEAVRAMLPDRIAGALRELAARATQKADTFETLSAVDAALDALAVAYDQALALAPELSRFPDAVEDYPAPQQPGPWLIEEPWLVDLRNDAETSIARVLEGGDITLYRWGDTGYVMRLRAHGVPLVFYCGYDVWRRRILYKNAKPSEAVINKLRTSLPRALPGLSVREVPAARGEALGEAAFDKVFSTHGARATASLLGPDARRALLGLTRRSVCVVIGGGMAEVTWSGMDLVHAFPNALDLLVALRRVFDVPSAST